MAMDTTQAETTDAQTFETWCCDANLSESTISVLKKEELDDLEILKLLPASEISDLGIPKGQALLLRTALKRIALKDSYETSLATYTGYGSEQEIAGGSELRRRNIQDGTGGSLPPPIAAKRKHQLRDLNSFTQRKTVTQGLMDMAMLSANCSQVAVVLKGAMDAGTFGGYQMFLLTLLSLSMVLQLSVNVEEADDDDDDDEPNSNLAHKYNNWAMSLTLVIMADNVLISSLGIK
ncbi:Hypp4701 [Branchiostoma lanceolatum]|uniref:Hypp4701 protein n=1 Tax=Branchiostoma lanceolatum TaxID=7740 RepID=A0A8K0ACY6_BRALA|nr:Hypp4701 [Branchiostoma lanceolatum]